MKRYLILFTYLLVCVLAYSADIVLVTGVPGNRKASQAEMDRYARYVSRRLAASGIPYQSISEKQLNAQAISSAKVLIFPFNNDLSRHAAESVGAFVKKGGKLVVCFSSDTVLLDLLELEKPVYEMKRMATAASFAFDRAQYPVFPAKMAQASRGILLPQLREGVKTLAKWVDSQGKSLGIPAATMSTNGIYLTHVYLDSDPEMGKRFWLSALEQYVPGLWQRAAQAAIEAIPRQGQFQTWDDIAKHIGQADLGASQGILQNALQKEATAREHFQAGRYLECVDDAEEAGKLLGRALVACYASRAHEMRGAWFHVPRPSMQLPGYDWDKCIQRLAVNGFNAIFVNMAWGYVADYRSEVLPNHPDVEKYGDQIELCLAACRKYGVALHVWKVNWNMGHRTPDALVAEMQKAGRTQMTRSGKPTKTLAPQIQENFELEKNAMLEIVRKYPVDGIHFDYIRYPDSGCDYSPRARQALEAELGVQFRNWPQDCSPGGEYYDDFLQWRRDNITRLVREVYQEAKKIRPEVAVSAAVYGGWDNARISVAQEAEKWVRNGWLDFVCPMDYEPDNDTFAYYLNQQIPIANRSMPIYPGIGIWRLKDKYHYLDQVALLRKLGADGYLAFDIKKLFQGDLPESILAGSHSLAAGKLLPHLSPLVDFEMPVGLEELNGNFALGTRFVLKAHLPEPFQKAKNLQVLVERNGCDTKEAVQLVYRNKALGLSFQPQQDGHYRIVLLDEASGLIARSPVLWIPDEAEAAKIRLWNSAPQFAGTGRPKVAIWGGSTFGGKALQEALAKMDYDVALLYNFKPASLKSCDIVVLPQPEKYEKLFKTQEYADALNAFVQDGGGLLVTHSLVGISKYRNAVPEVVKSVTEMALQGSSWKIARHPITDGLPACIQESTFGDRIALAPVRIAGAVLTTPEGQCVMAAGDCGKGRYAACGLGLGIGPHNADADLTPVELQLFSNTLRWLCPKH